MSNVLQRSWGLARLSFDVLKRDKEMLLFPLLGGIFSILFTIAMMFPAGVFALIRGDAESLGPAGYGLMAIAYFGLAFIATFFNVCVVYSTKTRFEGGDATFMDSIRFAMSRVPQIAAWSMLSASVGLLLHALDNLAEKMGGAGKLIVGVVRSMLGLAWSVVTIFVVPAMVYEGVDPFTAIRSSVETVKRTWGESLVRHFGLGIVQGIFLGIGLLLGALLVALAGSMSPALAGVVLALLVVYVIAVVLVFQVLNSVFNTALYVYATQGTAPGVFESPMLAEAFRNR